MKILLTSHEGSWEFTTLGAIRFANAAQIPIWVYAPKGFVEEDDEAEGYVLCGLGVALSAAEAQLEGDLAYDDILISTQDLGAELERLKFDTSFLNMLGTFSQTTLGKYGTPQDKLDRVSDRTNDVLLAVCENYPTEQLFESEDGTEISWEVVDIGKEEKDVCVVWDSEWEVECCMEIRSRWMPSTF